LNDDDSAELIGDLQLQEHEEERFISSSDWEWFLDGWEELGYDVYYSKEAYYEPAVVDEDQTLSELALDMKRQLQLVTDTFYRIQEKFSEPMRASINDEFQDELESATNRLLDLLAREQVASTVESSATTSDETPVDSVQNNTVQPRRSNRIRNNQ